MLLMHNIAYKCLQKPSLGNVCAEFFLKGQHLATAIYSDLVPKFKFKA